MSLAEMTPTGAAMTWGAGLLLVLASLANAAILTMSVAIVFLCSIMLTVSGE